MDKHSISNLAEKFFTDFETRFRRKEKNAFLEHCKMEFASLGYADAEITVQKAGLGRNLLVGPPDADILVTAHYDTPPHNGFLLVANPIAGQALGSFFVALPIAFLSGLLNSGIFGGNPIIPFLVLIVVLLSIFGFFTKNKHNRNDNTSGVLGVFSVAALAAGNPRLRGKCAFVLFDNEEWGLLGSSAFAKWRKKNYPEKKNSQVFNLDCVGNGGILLLAAKKKHEGLRALAAFLRSEGFDLVEKRSAAVFLSDHAHFSSGVMISFAERSKLGFLYLPKIHTGQDTVCDLDTIEQLGASIYRYICSTAQNQKQES